MTSLLFRGQIYFSTANVWLFFSFIELICPHHPPAYTCLPNHSVSGYYHQIMEVYVSSVPTAWVQSSWAKCQRFRVSIFQVLIFEPKHAHPYQTKRQVLGQNMDEACQEAQKGSHAAGFHSWLIYCTKVKFINNSSSDPRFFIFFCIKKLQRWGSYYTAKAFLEDFFSFWQSVHAGFLARYLWSLDPSYIYF